MRYTDPDGRQVAGTIDVGDFTQKLEQIVNSIPELAVAVDAGVAAGAAKAVKASPWVLVLAFIFCLNGDSVNTTRQNEAVLSPEEAKVLLDKMNAEIDGIQSKNRGNQPAETYALVAKKDGHYPNLRTGELVYLKKGDVWKYGQTSHSTTRYPDKNINLTKLGLDKVEEFIGTKEECLIVEKLKLYKYVRDHDGELPPGNKIFR